MKFYIKIILFTFIFFTLLCIFDTQQRVNFLQSSISKTEVRLELAKKNLINSEITDLENKTNLATTSALKNVTKEEIQFKKQVDDFKIFTSDFPVSLIWNNLK